MKSLIASVLLASPLLVGAASPQPAPKKPTVASKPAAKSGKPAAVKKIAAKPVKNTKANTKATTRPAVAVRKAPSTPSRVAPRSAPIAAVSAGGAAVATGAGALMLGSGANADQMAIADRVYTGRIACEMGQHVTVARDDANPGHFYVSGTGYKFHMAPIGTSTGVVRLEDAKAGAVWLQIANKSMLMNQKAGQRLADECMSAEQLQVAESIKKNPPQNLLDSPPGK